MFVNRLKQPQKPGRLVVLGASGFIGRAILKASQTAGIDIIALGSRDIDLTANNATKQLEKLLRPHDSLIFCAAIDKGHRDDSDIFAKNLLMAQHVVAAAQHVSLDHIIYLSSDAVYPPEAELINEQTVVAPAAYHGAWHRARELLVEEKANIPLAILRLTAIYGSGDTHNAYGPNKFIRQATEHKTITLFGDGEDMRGHLYIDDAARLILAVACHKSTGVLNVNSGQSVAFHALASMVAARTGARIECIPPRMAVIRRRYDASRMMTAFPYVVLTPLEAGINQTLEIEERDELMDYRQNQALSI